MARSIVQIWSVTRKTIRRTRSRPLDPTRSGLKTAPTGPGRSLGRVGGGGGADAPGRSVEVAKCVHFSKAMVSQAVLKQDVLSDSTLLLSDAKTRGRERGAVAGQEKTNF